MIEWKVFDKRTSPEEIEEEYYLIFVNGTAFHAYHNAMEGYFVRAFEDFEVVYAYNTISHYAELNLPEVGV